MYAWIGAALLLLAVGGYAMYERGNAAQAETGRAVAVAKQAAAEADRDRAVAAAEESEKSVKALQENVTRSNHIIAQMVAEQAATNEALEEVQRAIAEGAKTDEPTRDFLVIPVPDYLGVQLNR